MDQPEKHTNKLKRPKSSGAIKFFSTEYDEDNQISNKQALVEKPQPTWFH